MKIDFNANFREISERLARAQTVSDIPKNEFVKVLGDLRDNGQKNKQIEDVAVGVDARTVADPKARVDFSPLTFFLPPVPAEAAPQVDAPMSEEGVKEPTLNLNVTTKVAPAAPPTHDAFAGLGHEARKDKVHKLVQEAAEKFGIDPALSLAVASVESSYNPSAVSQDGHFSKGLMQLLDATGKERLEEGAHYKPFDPEQNVTLGVSYLRRLHELFTVPETLGNNLTTVPAANSTSLEKIAVAAYNAGEGRVAWAQDQARRVGKNPALFDDISTFLPEITQQYVSKVIGQRSALAGRFS